MSAPIRLFVSCDPRTDAPYVALLEELSRLPAVRPPREGYGVEVGMTDREVLDRVASGAPGQADVLLVLIGADTWRRRLVDWEIAAALRQPAAGLCGLLLPTYRRPDRDSWSRYTLPPRLYRNVAVGYARLHSWPEDAGCLDRWIRDAADRRASRLPDNGGSLLRHDRSGARWYPDGQGMVG